MRVLLVTPVSPYSTEAGAHQRTHLLWKALCDVGDVDVLKIEPAARIGISKPRDGSFVAEVTYQPAMADLRRFLPNSLLAGLIKEYVDLSSYDVICGRYLRPISTLAIPPGLPTVVDLDDHRANYGATKAISGLVAAMKARLRWALEDRAARRFTRFWFVTDRDLARNPHLRGGVLRNIPRHPKDQPDFASTDTTMLFVASLLYPPNRHGIDRFLSRVWPRIAAAVPEARLRLAGAASPTDRRRWAANPRVEALGFVDDLDATYRNATFCIAPIYTGGGSNIKILESLAHGRACVTTTFSLEAFQPHFDGKHDVLAADSDAEMADHCVTLLRHPEQRESLARAGRRIVDSVFTYGEFRKAVHEGIERSLWEAAAQTSSAMSGLRHPRQPTPMPLATKSHSEGAAARRGPW